MDLCLERLPLVTLWRKYYKRGREKTGGPNECMLLFLAQERGGLMDAEVVSRGMIPSILGGKINWDQIWGVGILQKQAGFLLK